MWQTSGAKLFVNKNLGVYTNIFSHTSLATTVMEYGPANDQTRKGVGENLKCKSVNLCTTDARYSNKYIRGASFALYQQYRV